MIYNEVMSGGALGAGSAAIWCLYSPSFAVNYALFLPVIRYGEVTVNNNLNRLNTSSIGLVHWWNFSNVETPTIYDAAKGAIGSLVSSDPDLNWVYDTVRDGWVYTSSNGSDYISVNGITEVDNATQLTVSAWVYLDSTNSNQPIISKLNNQTGFDFVWNSSTGWTVHVPNGNSDRAYTGTAGYSSATWYQVTFVYNGNAANNTSRLAIWVNGVNQTLTYAGTIPASINGNNNIVTIGASGTDRLSGRLDDIRMYSRLLTDPEVQRNSNPLNISGLSSQQTVVAGITGVSGEGALAAGTATVTFANQPYLPSGGVQAAGVSILSYNYLPSGGVWGSGSADLSFDFITFNGVYANGVAGNTSIMNEPPIGQAAKGALAGGSSNTSAEKFFSYDGSGSITMGGACKGGITGIRYNGSGEIVLDSATEITDFVFDKLFTFIWSVRTSIENNYTFLWNVGQLTMFWYRVVSKGVDNGGCPLQGDPCCQKFIVTLHARTLGELCDKLSKRKYKFPIESVVRFSRPAENSAVAADAAAGKDDLCQQLIPVQLCAIPQCANFCVDNDLQQEMGFGMSVQINAFQFYTMSGSAYWGGAAGTVLVRNLPAFPCTMSGAISVTGDANCVPNSFEGRGGALGGGAAFTQSSRWTYVGGNWPYDSTQRFGNVNTNVTEEIGDVVWQLPERVNRNDNLFSQADISFGKKSELLLTTLFNFSVPSDYEIIGLQVHIDRLATQAGVRDFEIYLVKNGVPISDNLADPTIDWPLIETERVYGNDWLGNGLPWRDPNGDHYLGPLTADDINDPTFGVAIRVAAVSSLQAQLAKVNYISVEVYADDANGSIVRMGGEAPARSPSYHYLPAGKSVVDSLSVIKMGFRYLSNGIRDNGTAAIQMTGHSANIFYETMDGGAVVDGDPKVTPYLEFGSGGAVAAGDAKVTPYFETMGGGVIIEPLDIRSNYIHYTGSGTITLTSNAFTPEKKMYYTTSGGFTLGSAVTIRSNHWGFVSDGNVILMGGGADERAGSQGTLLETMAFGMTVLETTATFLNDVDMQNALIVTDTVAQCGCLGIPMTVDLTHNLTTNNILGQFLARNNYPTPTILKMRYNTPNNSWQCNLHYRGVSADSSVPEAWDLTFELQCTAVMGGIGIGRSIWKLALQISRKNLATREVFDTRVIVGLLPETICGVQGAELDFNVSYDTKINLAVVTPSATVYQNTIYDNIGLFRNPWWINNPVLDLVISQASSTRPVQRVDLTNAVLVN